MNAFRSATASRSGISSPSITLEKGAYRMRHPYPKPPGQSLNSHALLHSRRMKLEYPSTSPNMAMIVILLAFACVTSFATAYYLFVTRWDFRTFSPRSSTYQPPKAVLVDVYAMNDTQLAESGHYEKFLAYLPHSGFHNQRIAFENALVLARLLNRTLLVPPVRLGVKPLRYLNFDALYQALALSDKEGLCHCARIPPYIPLPLECADYFDYTHISWDWLLDLTEVKDHQRLLQRWNMTDVWIHEYLKIPEADVLTIKDNGPYQYRFLDSLMDVSPVNNKFTESIYLSDLALSSKRLIHIGTLFGSSRLRLKDHTNVAIRGNIRQSMSYFNPVLTQAANSIVESMGRFYLSVHLRLGDGQFQKEGESSARTIWWSLVHQILEYTTEETLFLERLFLQQSSLAVPPLSNQLDDIAINLARVRNGKHSLHRLRCKSVIHTSPHFLRLNIPLFIATDLNEPDTNPLLLRFHKTFPCIFYTSDFPTALVPLMKLQNNKDGVMLNHFLFPFLDAMVAARAEYVIGTEGSTFSQFVQDVLWRTYHGRPILQRG